MARDDVPTGMPGTEPEGPENQTVMIDVRGTLTQISRREALGIINILSGQLALQEAPGGEGLRAGEPGRRFA